MKPLFLVGSCGLLLLTSDAAAKSPISVDDAFRVAFAGTTVRDTEFGTLIYSPGKLTGVGNAVVLISEGQNADDCHACSGALAVHYLSEKADGWHVSGEWLTASGGGSWGHPGSNWGISTSLLEYPVLYSESGGTWQGCSSSVANFLPLLPDGPGESVMIPLFHDNSGGYGDLVEVEGRIFDIRPSHGFKITYSGKRRAKSWEATDQYFWTGSGFSMNGEPSLETC